MLERRVSLRWRLHREREDGKKNLLVSFQGDQRGGSSRVGSTRVDLFGLTRPKKKRLTRRIARKLVRSVQNDCAEMYSDPIESSSGTGASDVGF